MQLMGLVLLLVLEGPEDCKCAMVRTEVWGMSLGSGDE
jgi:hypothetical protein